MKESYGLLAILMGDDRAAIPDFGGDWPNSGKLQSSRSESSNAESIYDESFEAMLSAPRWCQENSKSRSFSNFLGNAPKTAAFGVLTGVES